MSKETNLFEKKLQKYEEAIIKLKGDSDNKNKVIRDLQSSRVNDNRKKLDSVRMYTTKEKQEELKKSILEKVHARERKSQERVHVESKKKKERSLSRSRSIDLDALTPKRQGNTLDIIKTKQTIEIVFQPGSRRKNKELAGKDLRQAQSRLIRLQR